ncbi:hypothetical protein ASD11_16970 [Aeromicrobium sp. Root495]|uniref:acyl-CoA dehydrogenase family protein n=1 Tax=Aeromicrobium sp. Root495 TaxID=1736550 RepID=UPI0006F7B868|nr:acyl-CoA dehydrogenase family protein [Aeromicrobium sp. Root495]KQY56154.1 hypothetical protein ASD11_16970 [Aeromicrobium sp. Root495]
MSDTAVDADLADLLAQIDVMVAGAYDAGSARRRVDSGSLDRAAWRRLAGDLGLVGLHLPAHLGGQDQPFACTAAVASALGRRLAPAPHLGALGPATRLLAQASSGHRDRYLAPVLDGRSIVAVAGLEGGIDAARPVLEVRGGTVSGRLPAVLDADVADLLVVVSGDAVLVVETDSVGVTVTPVGALDLTRGRARVELDSAPAEVLDATSDDVRRAVLEATCLLAAESIAGAEACLDAALDYARLRSQFGRPIGAFQALQHALADLFGDVVSARAAVGAAVRSVDEPGGGAEETVRVAAVAASEAYRRAARENVHVHGGIGFTWEHDAHLHLRRALTDRPLLGDPVSHRRALGRLAVERAR